MSLGCCAQDISDEIWCFHNCNRNTMVFDTTKIVYLNLTLHASLYDVFELTSEEVFASFVSGNLDPFKRKFFINVCFMPVCLVGF